MNLFALLWLAAAQLQPLDEAYRALRAKAYDEAIAAFREAARREPERAAIHKDLAYALLKTGETAEAREQFAEAMKLDPGDERAALEYGFLCFETKNRFEARRTFNRIRTSGRDPAARATAEQAYQAIDGELREGMERWSAALAQSPDNYSATLELARLAEDRGEWALAAGMYERARTLKSGEHSLLIDLARVLRRAGQISGANAAFDQAWRSGSPRVSEMAREMLPSLASPKPNDELSAKAMGFRSYQAGFLRDALTYLTAAHRADPSDAAVDLKLGWTYNVLHQDREALRWFDSARHSLDPAIRAEAEKAWRNLKPPPRVRTTVWVYPLYSSRWKDLFGYAQVKSEFQVKRLPVRPYLTVRFIGDTRRTSARPVPEYLSESAFLPGVGVSAAPAAGVTLWAEAAAAVGYRSGGRRTDRASADYRGGLAISRGFGRLLGGESSGVFAETSNDIVFLSRFHNDTVAYSQNRFGYTLPVSGGLQTQLCWQADITQDARREYWADFVEFGPGLRFRFKSWPPSLVISASVLRGVYTRNEGNPRRPNFYDVRVGFWYAFTK